MVLKYPERHSFYVDYGLDRVYYKFYVDMSGYAYEQGRLQWCRENFKLYSWWYRDRHNIFVFVREKDAAWFALRWC